MRGEKGGEEWGKGERRGGENRRGGERENGEEKKRERGRRGGTSGFVVKGHSRGSSIGERFDIVFRVFHLKMEVGNEGKWWWGDCMSDGEIKEKRKEKKRKRERKRKRKSKRKKKRKEKTNHAMTI